MIELMLEDVLADVQTEYEWRECLDALQEAAPSRRHGCSVAHDEERWYPWETSTSSMETWNMHVLGAKKLLDCPYWKRRQGISGATGTTETCCT